MGARKKRVLLQFSSLTARDFVRVSVRAKNR